MKLWCDCCDKVQSVEVTDERCAKTYAAYQDIVCAECRLVIASGSEIRRTWVGLTDEEGAEIWGNAHDIDWKRLVTPKEIVQRISDKLKQKNT